MGKLISFGIFLAIILGLIFPIGLEYKFLIPIFLGVILFFNFLKLDYKFNNFFRKELIYYFLIGIIILPFVVFLLTKNLDINLRIGIFLVAITPTAISAPIIVDMIKGNRELVVSNVVFYNLLSPITYTVLLSLFFSQSDLIIPAKQIFIRLSTMIFLPLILALSIRKSVKIKSSLIKISKFISPLFFVLVIAVAVSSASTYLYELDLSTLLNIGVITFLLAISSFFIGFFLSRKEKIKKTLAVIFGHKNSTLTTWVVLSNFPPITVIPMVFYIIFHHLINAFLIHKYSE